MANAIHIADHKFIRLARPKKYLVVFLMLLVATSLVYCWLLLLQVSSWFIFLFPFYYAMIPLLEKPISILSGAKKYYSPLLIVWSKNFKTYNLHLGTAFDYFMALDFKANSSTYKTQILIFTLEGMLNIIDELKISNNKNATIVGTSYFLSKTTAERFGFEYKKASRKQIGLLIINYINLFFLLSLVEKKIKFPNLFQTKKIQIDGASLIDEELKIRRSYEYLRAKFLKAKAAQERERTSHDLIKEKKEVAL